MIRRQILHIFQKLGEKCLEVSAKRLHVNYDIVALVTFDCTIVTMTVYKLQIWDSRSISITLEISLKRDTRKPSTVSANAILC